MNVRLATKSDAFEIARIHQEAIKKGFLSSLNTEFLCKFYEALIASKYSFCVAATQNSGIVGFVSGVTDMNAFYRYFFTHYFFVSTFIISPKVFNPSVLKKIIENIFYPKKTKDLPSAELLTIAVKKEFQGKGVGGALLKKFIEEMKNRQTPIFKVLVGKNLQAVGFYRKNGFEQIKEIILHNNETSLVFIYKI